MKKQLRFDQHKDDLLKWKGSMRILLAGLVGMAAEVCADAPIGIVGGQDNAGNAYSSLVLQSGTLALIDGLPANGTINATAMNQLGSSLIGGQTAGNGYVATVSPDGALNSLSFSFTGTIYAVAINQGGTGLFGGYDFDVSGPGFAAFITPDGTITPAGGFPSVSTDDYTVYSTAINDLSVGLIGGEGDGAPYAAYVYLDGTVAFIPDTPDNAGHIISVALNDQGTGIIGGISYGTTYAAFVTATGPSLVLSPTPSDGTIYSVAINNAGPGSNAGIGLIGGQDSSNGYAYAGYSTPRGVVTSLLSSNPFSGTIYSVALNTSGAGVIGGQNGSDLYAALVNPNGTVISVINTAIAGQINSVAINDPGIALIGGTTTEAYAALVAPNGTLTVLSPVNAASIASVSIIGSNSILNAATPQSIGPNLSVAYTQLAAISALETHFIEQNNPWTPTGGSQVAVAEWNEDELLASIDTRYTTKPKGKAAPAKQNSVWIAPFGDYVHLREQGKIPNYKNQIAGALLGYDRQGSNYLVGACLGYAFNYISYGQGMGHGKIQEEMGCFYGSYLREHYRLNAALWGGFYQFWNTRHTLSSITSKAKTHGWILSPHLEMATPWAIDQKKYYQYEPFFSLDWINSWQKRYTESGSAGFNLKIGNLYSSLLQSEVGLRFYERFPYGWGDFCLVEKISYVNQAPFHVNSTTTSFVGAASSFPIAVASNKVQNLGALELIGSFVPKNNAYPYGGIALQAMANGSYQSYFANLFVGIDF